MDQESYSESKYINQERGVERAAIIELRGTFHGGENNKNRMWVWS